MKLPCESGDDFLKRRCLESPVCFDPAMKKRYKNTWFWIGFTLQLAVFRRSCENTLFTKSAPLSGRFNVFDAHVARRSEKYQKRLVFERLILRHFGTSSRHLDRTRRDLDVKAAQYSKCAPLCSRLLVFLKSMSRRARKP